MSRYTRILAGALAGLLAAALLTAGTTGPKGNDGKGRYYFRQTCKECHTKGAKGGEITPLTKTQPSGALTSQRQNMLPEANRSPRSSRTTSSCWTSKRTW